MALDTIEGPVDTLVGYSMGGRMALRLVVDQLDVCGRLVLLGATAGLADPGDRRQRRSADAALAARLRSDGPEKFLDFWLGLPLFADLSDSQQFRVERLAHWGSGVPETLEHRGTGNMEPIWSRLSTVQMPVLALAGERDQKFTALGRALSEHIGENGTFESIAESGHACHLQHPSQSATAILRWRFGDVS
jgi:2-succinyl-6-hydroxy-2,4-cyclohexadiene-1-carboxylate synthase